jgi:hypothetical protein
MSQLVAELESITDEPDDDFPSESAVERFKRLVAECELTQPLPRGAVCWNVGVRVEWNFGKNAVFLEISNSGTDYIFWSRGEQHGLVRDVTPEALQEFLLDAQETTTTHGVRKGE